MAGESDNSRFFYVEGSAEEKFRLAVELCPNGMVMTDADGRIVLVNAATERLFDYRRDELIGEPVEVLLPMRLCVAHVRHRAEFVAKAKTRPMGESRELSGRRRDGSEFPVEIGLNPIRTPAGTLVLSTIVDISERRRMDRVKDEFVSTVSHELRTPLTSIAGSLGLLVGGAAGKLPDAAVRLISIAQTNSQRLVRLINDFLDVEKIESGQITFKFRDLSARALVEQVIEANRGYADGFGVRVRLDVAASVGNVYADADRLAQVVTNLLSNAIKFAPRDSEVVVAIEERTETVRISVRDHGPGIPMEFRPRIFERFAQADAGDARGKGGSGLGLNIVKQIMMRLGGSVGFEDAPGGGTVFYVELPGRGQFTAREIDSERNPQAARILFCEDNPDTALALREGLRPAGFSTDFAHSPVDAMARARSAAYAAILVDLDLRDGDGIELIRQFREQPEVHTTPIVAVSANGGARDIESGLDVLEYVQKPLDIDRLVQILNSTTVRGANGRPRILHVDDDPDVLELVARTLKATAGVISAQSIAQARQALAEHQFDLAILDISLGSASGLDLLPELRRKGKPIPVIVFSAHSAELKSDAQVEANLVKSSASLEDLLVTVHDRLMLNSKHAAKEAV